MHINFTFLCDAASQGANGKIDALGIGVSRLFASALPVQHPMLFAVAEVAYNAMEAGPKAMALRLIDADGRDVIPPVNSEFFLAAIADNPACVAHLILQFAMVQFTAFGDYAVELAIDGRPIASLPLAIVQAAT